MDGREFARWKRFYALFGPFGPARGDLQAGIVARAVTAANGGRPPPLASYVIGSRPAKEGGPGVTGGELQSLARRSGLPFTPGPGVA